MPPTKLPISNFDPLFSLEFIVAVIVTDEETDVTELLWVVAIVDVDIWDVCCETLVILIVDFNVVEVIFAETPCVVI